MIPSGLAPACRIVELCVASAWVKNGKPVSVILVAIPETGRTSLMRMYADNTGVLELADFTKYGLTTILKDYVSTGKVRTLMVPDFLTPMARGGKVSGEAITLLNMVMEEGLKRIKTKFIDIDLKQPVNMNLITALPSEIFKEATHGDNAIYNWTHTGTLSRLVAFRFDLLDEDVERIRKDITKQVNPFASRKLPLQERTVKITKEQMESLAKSVQIISAVNKGNSLGFRMLKNAGFLAQAAALLAKRNSVNEEDVREIKSLLHFCMPFGSDECKYRIIRALPATTNELERKLAPFYSKPTVEKRLKELSTDKFIIRNSQKWRLV